MTLPEWAGDADVIEGITFGYGSYGHRCRLCGQDDWDGTLVHLKGCPGADLEQPGPPRPPDDLPDPLWGPDHPSFDEMGQ